MGIEVLSALTCPATLLDGDGDRVGAMVVLLVRHSFDMSPLCHTVVQALKHLQGRTTGLRSYSF